MFDENELIRNYIDNCSYLSVSSIFDYKFIDNTNAYTIMYLLAHA